MVADYSLSIVYINILSYLYLNFCLFILVFIFDTNSFKTLNDFKYIGGVPFFSLTLLIIIFSLAGVPPMIGFVSKSLIFIFMFFKKNFLFMFLLSFLNFFIIYFYIRNIRYLVTKSTNYSFIFDLNYSFINWNLTLMLVFFNFINITSLFFVEDFLLLCDNLVLYQYFF